MNEHQREPGSRQAQHLLASEVVELVHGPEEAAKTRREHETMRRPTVASLLQPSNTVLEAEAANHTDAAAQRIELPRSLVENTPLSRILFHAGIVPTKSEGARTIARGGVYIASPDPENHNALNFTAVKEEKGLEIQNFLQDGLLVLRLGKWKVRVIQVVPDADFEQSGADAPGWAECKGGSGR